MIYLSWTLGIIALLYFRRKAAALPPLFLGIFFSLLGTFGAWVWLNSRVNNGAGLPSLFGATTSLNGPATLTLGAAAVACFAVSIVAGLMSDARFSLHRLTAALDSDLARRASMWVILISYSLWLAGEGPSVLKQNVYLQTDGSQFALKTFSLLAPLAALVGLILLMLDSRRKIQTFDLILAAIWWTSATAVGTRLAVGFALILGVGLIRLLARPRNLFSLTLAVVATYFAVWCSLATFGVTLIARSQPHGLLLLPELFASSGVAQPLDPTTWIVNLQQLGSSLSAAFPIVEQSIIHHPDASIVIGNLNPLPSSWIHVDPYTYERLWPYFWVPLCFLGEVDGIWGAWSVICIVGAVAAISSIWSARFERRGSTFGTILMIILSVTFGLVSIQYPSRTAGRVMSFVVFVPFAMALLGRFTRHYSSPHVFHTPEQETRLG